MLRGIALTGSISTPRAPMGISYKAAWQAVETLSGLAGARLVERTVGGSGGGGARLTRQGEQLLVLAEELALAHSARCWPACGGRGALGGLGLRTSMRNQIACEIEDPASPWPRGQWPWCGCAAGGDMLLSQITPERGPARHRCRACGSTPVQGRRGR